MAHAQLQRHCCAGFKRLCSRCFCGSPTAALPMLYAPHRNPEACLHATCHHPLCISNSKAHRTVAQHSAGEHKSIGLGSLQSFFALESSSGSSSGVSTYDEITSLLTHSNRPWLHNFKIAGCFLGLTAPGTCFHFAMARTIVLFAALLIAGCVSAFQLNGAASALAGTAVPRSATSRQIHSCSARATPVALFGPAQSQSVLRSDRTRLGVTAGFKLPLPTFTK